MRVVTAVFLFIVSLSGSAFAQQKISRVALEDPSPEQLRHNNVFHKQIRPKEKAYAKRSRFLNEAGYQTGPIPPKKNKAALTKYIVRAQKVLARISHESLKGYCTEINHLRKSIGEYQSDACKGLESRIKHLTANIAKVKNYQQKNRTETAQQSTQKDVLSSLERASDTARQATSQAEDVLLSILGDNKEKTLGDFLADLSDTNTSANYDPLAGIDAAPADSDDPLAGMLAQTESKSAGFKIDYKNGNEGVRSSSGETLIPYKAWRILDYQDGIAKVSITIREQHQCSLDSQLDWGAQGSWRAARTGFVDIEGEFLDGETLSFEFWKAHTLYLTTSYSANDFDTWEEYQAHKRKVARMEAREDIAYQKCKLEAAQWKQGIARAYK
ncbi:MAG: hypothetical protein COA42_17690 [Alteromonadaceae bacterium]|nr:MAG: hypothetical protein COA42_17690 [Alteromonadaceae bacterium]